MIVTTSKSQNLESNKVIITWLKKKEEAEQVIRYRTMVRQRISAVRFDIRRLILFRRKKDQETSKHFIGHGKTKPFCRSQWRRD